MGFTTAAKLKNCSDTSKFNTGGGRGNLRDAKTPPTARLPPMKPTVFITTRHAASLRPPRNGRIGFKPPYSKRETAAKGPLTHAHPFPRAPPTHEAHGFYHDAARRVATSSEKRENRFKPPYSKRGRGKRPPTPGYPPFPFHIGYKNVALHGRHGTRMEAAAMATSGSQCDAQGHPRKRRL